MPLEPVKSGGLCPHFIIMEELRELLQRLREEAKEIKDLHNPKRMGVLNTVFKIEYWLDNHGKGRKGRKCN